MRFIILVNILVFRPVTIFNEQQRSSNKLVTDAIFLYISALSKSHAIN